MAFTLRLLFLGLCAHVPNKVAGKPMRVLIIDGRAPGLSSPQTGSRPHVSHVPSVRFNIADLDEQATEMNYYVYYNAKEKNPKGMWVLNGDDLEVKINGESLPDGDLTVHTEGENSLFLIPTLKNIYPETGGLRVNKKCLDDSIEDLTEAGLVGRIKLKNGVVGTYAGEMGEHISPDEHTFTGVPNGFKQRVADCVFYETQVEAENVEIFSKQLGQALVLRPSDGKVVEVIIENEPTRGIEMVKPGCNKGERTDGDFELLYRIAEQQPKDLRVPVIQPITQAASMTSNSNPSASAAYNAEEQGGRPPAICGSAVYNAEDQAKPPAICGSVVYNAEDQSQKPIICASAVYNAEDQAEKPVICASTVYNAEDQGPRPPAICGSVVYNAEEQYPKPLLCASAVYNAEEQFTKPVICASAVYNAEN